jgi:cytochrome b6-f complex iron-sulfur subunit
MDDLPRRDFLSLLTNTLLAASGLLGLGGLLRYLNFSSEAPRKTEFALGSVSDYPPGSRTLLTEIPALLIHDEAGFSALSLVCTHLGCTVEEAGSGFACPCHGSRFDPQGEVQRGPAARALASLRVAVDADEQLRVFLD